MATAHQSGGVLPRPRIPNVVGILNLYVAAVLILVTLVMAGYIAILPRTGRAMSAMQKQADAKLAAQRAADLKQVEEQEKTAETASRKSELAARRKEIEATPTKAFPMDLERMGMGWSDTKVVVYQWVDVVTALALNILLLAAGVGLVRRQAWGVRLGLGTAAAKIARLVLAYGFVIVVLVPPFAQALGRMVGDMFAQQQRAMGAKGGGPPAAGLDAAFMTKMYAITYTVMFVALILVGSIYPAISLWFLSRPGARAACTEPGSRFKALSGSQVLGSLNILFAASLLVFGLLFSAYVAALPLVARGVNQLQERTEAQQEQARKAELKALEAEEKAATTDAEKQAVREQRKAIESKPKQAVMAKVDLNSMLGKSPKMLAFYLVELASGVILNLALLVAGIALVRQKRWGINLGIGTAIAKIARLVLVYTYFTLALAGEAAQENGTMAARMLAFQQQVFAKSVKVDVDPGPLIRVNLITYQVLPVAIIVVGSIYPAVSIWLLTRGANASSGQQKNPPGLDWSAA